MNEGAAITRIDLTETTRGVIVKKYPDGWTASTHVPQTMNNEKTFDEMVAWLQGHGWVVYKWPEVPELGLARGARAFLGRPLPVRTKCEIVYRRSQLQTKLEKYLGRPDPYTGQTKKLPIDLVALDLAYQT
jgi:hypothetical protein